jgi:hypothetical protein
MTQQYPKFGRLVPINTGSVLNWGLFQLKAMIKKKLNIETLFLILFWDRVSVCNQDWPRTCYTV